MDSRICQTSAASPAKPGELPCWIRNNGLIIIHAEGVCESGVGWEKRYHPRRRRAGWFSIIRRRRGAGVGWRERLTVGETLDFLMPPTP